MQTLEMILKYFVAPLIPLLGTGLVALGALAGKWLHEHAGQNKLLGALASGADFVGAAVAHVMAGLQPKFAAALANDGKIDQAELDEIKSEAMKLIKAELPSSLQTLAAAYGPTFETWLSGKVSQAVNAQAAAMSPKTP